MTRRTLLLLLTIRTSCSIETLSFYKSSATPSTPTLCLFFRWLDETSFLVICWGPRNCSVAFFLWVPQMFHLTLWTTLFVLLIISKSPQYCVLPGGLTYNFFTSTPHFQFWTGRWCGFEEVLFFCFSPQVKRGGLMDPTFGLSKLLTSGRYLI